MWHPRALPVAGLVLVLLASVMGCGTEPLYRSFDASVISPNGLEGAVVLELEGTFLGVTAPSGSQVFTHASEGVTRVVIVLTNPGNIQFTLTLDDLGEAPDVRIIEVADGANELRVPLRGYRVEFTGVAP
ncbi:MAG: hypothetical protein OER90_11855 [Gemmatimonadota bacterium]|nr:hypothetical protein [Gemmatimonadota bacterium]